MSSPLHNLDEFLASEGPAAINPDMPRELLVDIGKCASLRPWKEEAIKGFRVRQNLTLLRQRMIGLASRRLQHFKKAGMKIVARIDPDLFWQHRLKYGPGCWHDREFREDTLKRHPEMRVESEDPRKVIPVRSYGHVRSRQTYPTISFDSGGRRGTQSNTAAPLSRRNGHVSAAPGARD